MTAGTAAIQVRKFLKTGRGKTILKLIQKNKGINIGFLPSDNYGSVALVFLGDKSKLYFSSPHPCEPAPGEICIRLSLIEAIKYAHSRLGVSPKQFLKTVIKPEELEDELKALDFKDSLPNNKDFPVFVDYEESLEDLIRTGKYALSDFLFNSNLRKMQINMRETARTKSRKKAEIVISLVHLDCLYHHSKLNFDSSDLPVAYAKEKLKEMGFRPAVTSELLALGRKYHKSLKWQIDALGSRALYKSFYINDSDGYAYPFLCKEGSRLSLGINFGPCFTEESLCAAVRI